MITLQDAKQLPGGRGLNAVLAAPIGSDAAPRTVGPFALVVHARTPATIPGALPVDADVRPHPHIGLAAISYVIEGAVTHRDSIGNRCELRAGDLGGTVSGRGVVHSERLERNRLFGSAFEMFQMLLALPDGSEDVEPSFFHRTQEEHASSSEGGATVRWLFAAPPGAASGMPMSTPILLADVTLEADAQWLVSDVPERALYVREGEIEIGQTRVRAGQIAIAAPGDVTVRALSSTRLLAFGGTGVSARYMWWNYMHSSLECIEAAKADWREGRMKLPDGDTESFTPCPPDDGRPLWRLNQG